MIKQRTCIIVCIAVVRFAMCWGWGTAVWASSMCINDAVISAKPTIERSEYEEAIVKRPAISTRDVGVSVCDAGTGKALSSEIDIHEGVILVDEAQFVLLREDVLEDRTLKTEHVSACVGVCVRATKGGVRYFGLGHIWRFDTIHKEPLAYLRGIHTRLMSEGFKSEDITYVVDYRDTEYKEAIAVPERKMAHRDVLEDAMVFFHQRWARDEVVDDLIEVTRHVIVVRPHRGRGMPKTYYWNSIENNISSVVLHAA